VKPPPGGIDFSKATTDPDTGQECVTVAEEVEKVTKDPLLTCVHRSVQKCHYTYRTQFTPSQEEVCREEYQKTCRISFRKKAVNEKVKKCYKPVERVCTGQGEEKCYTVYETACSTRYVETVPGKNTAQTSCEKLPVEICGAGCEDKEGAEECHEKVKATVVDVPEELCDLSPKKTCRLVTKLVPKLTPSQECTVVPQETCSWQFRAPRTVKKPIWTKWCLEVSKKAKEEERSSQALKPSVGKSISKSINTPKNTIDTLFTEAGDSKDFDDEGGFEVDEVRTNIERKFPPGKSGPKFEKPIISENIDNSNLINDKIKEDEDITDIVNPFENKEDVLAINHSEKLSDEEKKDLESFNIGLYLEQFRTSIDNVFQMQDFSDFVDFDDF